MSNVLYLLKDEVKAMIGAVSVENANSTALWHESLGQPSIKEMEHISSLKIHINNQFGSSCEIIPIAKQSRLDFT